MSICPGRRRSWSPWCCWVWRLLLAGLVLGGAVQIGGWALFGVAFFAAWRAAIDLFPFVAPVVAIALTVAIEVLAIFALVAGLRAIERLHAAAARRRFANERGWQFDRTADIAIGGPLTAYHLLGVPNAAAQTVGVHVVRGTVGSFPITVFDRHRPRPRRTDPVQTVWLATLPFALPFVSSTFLACLAAEEREASPTPQEAAPLVGGGEYASFSDTFFGPRAVTDLRHMQHHTTDVTFARALVTAQVRAVLVGRPWWILENQLVVVNGTSTAQSASARETRLYTERLLNLVSAIDWAAVSRFAR